MYHTQSRADCNNSVSAHFRNTRLVTILHSMLYNRTQILCTIGAYVDALLFPQQGVLPSSLRGNCSRWERCHHAGGAVVQLCRESIVCWPQCPSAGSSVACGTIRSASSASFCPLFLARQKKWVAEGTVAVSPQKRYRRCQPERLRAKPPQCKSSLKKSSGCFR